MESESGTTKTKISDSGYSNSCSNTNSQRSASSKSRHSGSNSSRSSGYCGGAAATAGEGGGTPDGVGNADPNCNSEDTRPQPPKRNKEKEHKKKKLKSIDSTPNLTTIDAPAATPPPNFSTADTSESQGNANGNGIKEVTPEQEIGLDFNASAVLETADANVEIAENSSEPALVAATPVESAIEPALPSDKYWKDDKAEIKTKESRSKEEPELVEINTKTYRPEDGFCCIISMDDGVVLYTTSSLTASLGFPKDMWLGRSFIDFVHPKDREMFSSQVTAGIAVPLIDSEGKFKDYKSSLYVCLRKYRGLKSSGFGVVEKAVCYQAFRLTVKFKCVADAPETTCPGNNSGIFLVVIAIPVHTCYKVPEERKTSPAFNMRHNTACVFSHVDQEVVSNFGFLPQDMLGKSVFDFYHPEDMPFLKEVYESVMNMCQIAGSVFRSKPYRFAVQNGGFVMVETEWSSFVNPWSRRMEFVIGLHRVLQGPLNPDVFEIHTDEEIKNVSEEVFKESRIIQGEILLLLNKELPRPSEAAKHEVSKRCKDIANFMEILMEEVNKSNLQLDLPQELDPTISDRDSVMLGEISPHHEYQDSKSSTETPPSYNQLNYNENIQRFFQSKPKTTGSDEGNSAIQVDIDQEVKPVQDCNNGNQKCLSPIENSGTSGSGSAGNLSSVTNPNIESGTTSATNTSTNDSYKPLHLTESLLFRHNEDMEKMMIKRHREQRSSVKDREGKKPYHKNEKGINGGDKNEQILMSYAHGVKRSGSYSRDGENHKVSKYKHQTGITNLRDRLGAMDTSAPSPKLNNVQIPTSTNTTCSENIYHAGINDVNLWPPFSMTVTPLNDTQPCNISTAPGGPGGYATSMFPVYYIATPPQRPISGQFPDPLNPSRYQVSYMPGMIYPYSPTSGHLTAIYSTSPIICPTPPVLPVPMMPPIPSIINPQVQPTQTQDFKGNTPVQTPHFQRPASQATSVKAEPGSAMGSIASASVANKALSESSRKDAGLQSVCSPDSPLVSPPDGEMELFVHNSNKATETTEVKKNNNYNNYINNNQIDESSSYYSSSYSSFLKTDAGSGSNDESNTMDNKSNKTDHNAWKSKNQYPIRKRDPPWLESVIVSPDLVYRYQMTVKDLEEILQEDLNTLKEISQPVLVNKQLNQLYVDMELEGLSKNLTLDEGITSSSGSEDSSRNINKPKRKRRSYSSLVMIYEENAPFPPTSEA